MSAIDDAREGRGWVLHEWEVLRAMFLLPEPARSAGVKWLSSRIEWEGKCADALDWLTLLTADGFVLGRGDYTALKNEP